MQSLATLELQFQVRLFQNCLGEARAIRFCTLAQMYAVAVLRVFS
jgi:hypothetical protein